MRIRLAIVLVLILPLVLPAAAASAADPCQPGSWSATGTGHCDPAPPGTFVDVEGATTATPCPVGTYQDESGATSCKLAEIGFYVHSSGAIAPTACQAGTTTEFLGAASADDCVPVAGTDSDGDGVDDADDACPGTVLPEATPHDNRYRADADGAFANGRGGTSGLTVADTGGCSAAQIIAAMDLGQGHVKHGLSIGALRDWVNSLG